MAKRRVKKKYTKNQELFLKEQRRLTSFIARKEKEGYWFDENIVPQMPKRVTAKALEEIKSITPNTLYKHAEWVDRETGEFMSARQKLTENRQKGQEVRKQKQEFFSENAGWLYATDNMAMDNFYDLVVKNFISKLHVFNGDLAKVLEDWVMNLVKGNGVENVAQMLLQGEQNGVVVTFTVIYHKPSMLNYMADMMTYLHNQGEIYAEQILEIYEQFDSIEEMEFPQ